MRISVYCGVSLDNFIARPDGGLDFLDTAGDPAAQDPAEDYGYAAFTASVDVYVMGRATFDVCAGFPEWPFAGKRVIVMSSSLSEPPDGYAEYIELSAETPAAIAARLAGEGVGRVYLDGGRLIQSFLRENLVTDLTITRLPILIGQGIPLFGSLPADRRLRLVATNSWPTGYVQSVYEVESPTAP